MGLIQFAAFVALASAAVAIFAYWSFRRRSGKDVFPIVVAGALAWAIAMALGLQQTSVYLAVAVAAVSAILPMLYRRKPMAFMLDIFLIAYAVAVSLNRTAVIGMFGIGALVGAIYVQYALASRREDRSMRKTATEMKRDLVQIALGLVVLLVLLIWQQGYPYILFSAILLACLFSNLISRTGAVYRGLSKFERRDVEFGIGALQLAIGAAILLGFAGYRLALFGVFPLFFGDALATMTGMHFYRSRKLPYNRRKSYAGTIGFFIATAIPGAVILGIWGVVVAVILTFVESIELPIDDNVALPIATVLLGVLMGAV